MGLQSNQCGVAFSIALLQQRFRELERIREERLLQMLVPRPAAPPPVKCFFHPDLFYPCRPMRDTSTASDCKSFQLTVELWPSKAYNHVPSEVDVDTSLHL